MPIQRTVGQQVALTKKSFQNIVNGNRGIHAFPDDSFVSKIKPYIGQQAEVTLTFPPGYEVNVTFPDGQVFQVKDHWVESV